MFVFKKIAAQFLFPCTFMMILFGVGIYWIWRYRESSTGRKILTAGFALFILLSYFPLPLLMLRSVENDYPPLKITDPRLASAKYIVVLSGGGSADNSLPPASRLAGNTLVRLVEGVRLFKQTTDCRLLLSGSSVMGANPVAEIMADVAEGLGVDRAHMIVESKSRDTKDQARIIVPIIGAEECVLVTSASHMTRAVKMFKKQGVRPIPAPVGHRIRKGRGISPSAFFPSASNLNKARIAIYEYAGIVWAYLRGYV